MQMEQEGQHVHVPLLVTYEEMVRISKEVMKVSWGGGKGLGGREVMGRLFG